MRLYVWLGPHLFAMARFADRSRSFDPQAGTLAEMEHVRVTVCVPERKPR